jgi:hypothetical protein
MSAKSIDGRVKDSETSVLSHVPARENEYQGDVSIAVRRKLCKAVINAWVSGRGNGRVGEYWNALISCKRETKHRCLLQGLDCDSSGRCSLRFAMRPRYPFLQVTQVNVNGWRIVSGEALRKTTGNETEKQ